MKYSQNELGYFYNNEKYIVFFGTVSASIEKLKEFYPSLNFRHIRQTHSDIVVESTESLLEADAHFTNKKNQALLIATADCTPLMIYCHQTQRVVAIHAGWRGVENKITEKTLNKLIATGSTEKKFDFFFGPHIMQDSFEVSEDVFLLLQNAQHELDKKEYALEKNDKFYVDLQKIILSQIKHVIKAPPQVLILDMDTKTNENFHSYRREKMTPERNLSFIAPLSVFGVNSLSFQEDNV